MKKILVLVTLFMSSMVGVMAQEDITTAIEEAKIDSTTIVYENNTIKVGDEKVEVYTLKGERAQNGKLSDNTLYIVKTQKGTKKFLTK